MFFKKDSRYWLPLVLLGVVAMGFMFIRGWLGFTSALLGGGAWFVPSLYFLWKMDRVRIIFDSKKMLKTFLQSEVIKLAFSFGLITMILLNGVVDRLSFLSGYVVTLMVTSLLSLKLGIKGVKND